MLDLRWIREHPDQLRGVLRDRGVRCDVEALLELDQQQRQAMAQVEGLRHEQRILSKAIGEGKSQGVDVRERLAEGASLSQKVAHLEALVEDLGQKIRQIMVLIPNIPDPSVPAGDAGANQVVRTVGDPRTLAFPARTHLELGEALGILDFPRSAKIVGTGFCVFVGWGARLERALINFMLDLHTQEHGYTEVFPPFLVNRASMFGTGQLPKLEEDMYRLRDDDYFLIPTAEVPVTNLHRDEILAEDQLPLSYTAYTACFRREAGSYGKDTRGLTRVHQFDKVELVRFVTPERSRDELEQLVRHAEEVLQRLELAYRVVCLATGDLSFAASKCYDLEAWAPGSKQYLEVSSCSTFSDFQARRANIRYRSAAGQRVEFVHTLNGSGVALARTVIALLETHQQADGSVVIPRALRPYVGGAERLAPGGRSRPDRAPGG